VRVLFLLLLLANLLFLAWTRWVAAPVPATVEAVAGSAGLQPIRLKSEGPAPSEGRAVTTRAPSASDAVAASCVSVGPFSDPAHAVAAEARLGQLGFTTRRRVSQDEVRVGSWVRVPDLATPADAANALEALRAAGLADAAIVADDGPSSTVSIGVYADPQKAAEAAEAVARAGFTPATSDRTRQLEVLWLDIDRGENGGLPSLEQLGPPAAGGLPYDLRACPSPTVAGAVTPPANPEPAPAAAPATG
jgi:SPOR domain